MSAPAFIAFYYVTAIESWTYINIIEYYRAKIEQKDLKQILDRVKKDLQVVANPNSDFDMRQQVLATRDNMIHNIDNSCTTLRNHQDVDNIEEIMDTKSAKTLMMKKELLDVNTIESFHKYQQKIPKTCKILTLTYWGILDLTRENLNDFEIKDEVIRKLSQDFSNKIRWNKNTITPNNIQKFFDDNCINIDKDEVLNKLDVNIQFMKYKMPNLIQMCTEEGLKMSTFPLFSGIFKSPNIKNTWGEIQAISTNKARNEKMYPFSRAKIGYKVDMKGTLIKTPTKFEIIYGEVSGGLGFFGMPASCRKKQYVDKVKLMIMLRDSLNQFFKICSYVMDEQLKKVIVYGWLQIGVELNFYAMDCIGSGIYRFGKLDNCVLPVDENNSSILEDA
ncbi:14280_t:CDS:2 [Entrophospora sp. SA101]|nr:14280_t:CDS:2 [Entrophospora sp. SA101]